MKTFRSFVKGVVACVTVICMLSSCDAALWEGLAQGIAQNQQRTMRANSLYAPVPACNPFATTATTFAYSGNSSSGSSVSSGSSSYSSSHYSSSRSSSSTMQCTSCQNTKKCSQCHGSGMRTDNMFGTGTSATVKCGICGGSGVCSKCGGTGQIARR